MQSSFFTRSVKVNTYNFIAVQCLVFHVCHQRHWRLILGDLIEGPHFDHNFQTKPMCSACWVWESASGWKRQHCLLEGCSSFPVLIFNAETNSADELTIELNLSEDLAVLRSMSLGPYAFPIVEICEIYSCTARPRH